MTDYKNTLNLPQTEFPMKANLSQREPEMLRYWEDIDWYNQLREIKKGRDQFILHDGPPYANGNIHMGTALNKILKDIIIKAKGLSGFDAPYVPGWDCHGLPIELNVEKKVGKPGRKVSVLEFRTACRQYAQKQVNEQRESFKRLGVIADWDHPYLTMNYTYEANILRCLAKVIQDGHLHRGYKPVHWCVDCGSALAEAEVEYQEKHSPSIDIRFRVLNEINLFERCHHVEDAEGEGDIFVAVWTTTPWTLPANQAVALNPEFNYAVIQGTTNLGVQRLLVAEALLIDVMVRYGIDDYRVIAYCKGKDLEGIKLQHPFYEREVPVILADHVTADAGTGAVHTAPGHGQEDYVVGQRYGLPVDNPVGEDGRFLPDTPIFAGEFVYDANDHVIEILKTNGTLLHHEMITHSYPHCWRHKTPLIFRATPQWFISMDQNHLREKALDAVAKTNWIPDWGQTRIADMVMRRPDWCISRQRTWGVPIALFIHKETDELHPNTVFLLEEVAKLVEEKGVEVWDEIEPKDLLGDEADQYKKVKDILDVWFDSGVSHTCVLKERAELNYPADLYLEGSDQHRGWFQSSIMTACAMDEGTPAKTILTHGFVVDGEGYKMSKSMGNVIAPESIIKTLGADILRLWVSSTEFRGETTISDEILKRTSDTYRRIRNTARFLLSNLEGFIPERDLIASHKMVALDRWAVDTARLFQEEIIKAYDEYQFHIVYQKIHHFCSVEMGSFYLDIIKDRQYTSKKEGLPRLSAQTAMYHIVNALVRWVAPILSFTADEIWKYLQGVQEKSVFFSTWYDGLSALTVDDRMGQEYWQEVMTIRDEINKEIEHMRAEGVLGSALEAEVTLFADVEKKALLDLLGDELRFVLITSSANVYHMEEVTEEAKATEVQGIKLIIKASNHPKCERCWHRRADVGANADHSTICGRCVENIEGKGEIRNYA